MRWFVPVAVVVGLIGTRAAGQSRRAGKGRGRDRSWWLLGALAWLPLVCWLCAQFILQG